MLFLGGMIFGVVNRMTGNNEVKTAVSVDPTSQPTEEVVPVVLFEVPDIDEFGGEEVVAEGVASVEASKENELVITPRLSEIAITEFRNRMRLEELQARSAGLQSTSKINFRLADNYGTEIPPMSNAETMASTHGATVVDDPLQRQRALLERLAQRGSRSVNNDPNKQTEKHQFITRQISDAGYLSHRVTPSLSAYELKTGTIIPGILLTEINSDLPGTILGQVSSNIYDTATGRYLLIPQGSKLIGAYDSKITYGQKRALVTWRRLVFPDGQSLNLDNMLGVDQLGTSGFSDKVDNHFGRVFGSLFGLSIFQAIPLKLKGGGEASELEKITATNISKTGEKLTEKNLGIQPTVRVRPGYRFNVLVNKDILFTSPYLVAQ